MLIPITYKTDILSRKLEWFNNKDLEMQVSLDVEPNWIKFNNDQVGYYRVNYPQDMWASLTNVLKNQTNALSIADRAHLINDVFSLAEATLIDYDVALELTSYLTNESEYVPWSVASTNLLNLKSRLYDLYDNQQFLEFGQSRIREIYKEVGWDVSSDDHLKNHLRTTVLNFACAVGLPECLTEVGNKFNDWLKNTDLRPSPDLRNIVYYYGMASAGNSQNWEVVWGVYMSEPDASEKAKLIYGLSGIKHTEILG
ncbi:Glutamyl aminopeptidase, partial [Pseudolycoriella hygida]